MSWILHTEYYLCFFRPLPLISLRETTGITLHNNKNRTLGSIHLHRSTGRRLYIRGEIQMIPESVNKK